MGALGGSVRGPESMPAAVLHDPSPRPHRSAKLPRPRLPKDRWILSLELGPLLLFYLAFFAAPLVLLVAYSFFKAKLLGVIPAFVLDSYITALTDKLFYQVLWNTITVGLLTATMCVLIAYPFVYIITFVFPRWRDLLLFLVLVTLFAGYLARIYAWRTLLGAEGITNSLLMGLGVISEPLHFLLYSQFAVVVAMLSIYLPFAIVPIASSMQNLGRPTVEASRDLGAGAFTAFRTVTLPITYAGFRSAFLFCFLLGAGDYVTPSMLGGPSGLMIGVVIRDQFYGANNWPLGAALSVLTVLFVVGIFLVLDRVMRLLLR